MKTAAALYTKEEAGVLLHEIQGENAAVFDYVQRAGLGNLLCSYTNQARFNIISNQAIESWNKVTKP